MALTNNVLQYIEDELREREWQLFGDLDHWSPTQRDDWRDAWRQWRQNHLARLEEGEASLRVWIESSCIGCFDCEIMCGEIFSVGKHRSQVRKECIQTNSTHGPHIKPNLINDIFDQLHMAQMACPVEAIKVCISESAVPEPQPQDFS